MQSIYPRTDKYKYDFKVFFDITKKILIEKYMKNKHSKNRNLFRVIRVLLWSNRSPLVRISIIPR